MSEITKLLSAAALIAAGFFGAAMFGSPDSGTTGSGPGGDWTPTALQPIASTTPTNTMTPSPVRDTSIVATGHNHSDPYDRAAGQTFTQHEVARPAWQPQAFANTSTQPSLPPPISNTTNSMSPPEDRFASISPPPALLDPSMQAAPMQTAQIQSMQSSGFPPRPSDAAPPAPSFASNSAPLSGPSLAPANGWLPPVVTTPPPSANAQPVAQYGDSTRHVVKDGDTLAKIAERYLGDPNRAREIYELNQSQLSSPDLLPIGAELQLPQAAPLPVATPSNPINVYDAQGMPSASYVPQSRMMPLPELPEEVRNAPRARLQPPVSASLVGTGS
ncbi:LysM peptidoglycan-binding domain-containing protein [Aeoliella sp. SH292]|uniref:LysM peptidoglycan-binding domain-containing protein n=1 Tax=Aeoliella sp. SH292 TaxID=3454464 RepID=UPI003F951E5D